MENKSVYIRIRRTRGEKCGKVQTQQDVFRKRFGGGLGTCAVCVPEYDQRQRTYMHLIHPIQILHLPELDRKTAEKRPTRYQIVC